MKPSELDRAAIEFTYAAMAFCIAADMDVLEVVKSATECLNGRSMKQINEQATRIKESLPNVAKSIIRCPKESPTHYKELRRCAEEGWADWL